MSQDVIGGLLLQAAIPTALFYVCFWAEVSAGVRAWLVERRGTGWLFKLGECPACAGFWFGWAAWYFNPLWFDHGWVGGALAALWSITTVPPTWWLLSRSLQAQQDLTEDDDDDEGGGGIFEILREGYPYPTQVRYPQPEGEEQIQ